MSYELDDELHLRHVQIKRMLLGGTQILTPPRGCFVFCPECGKEVGESDKFCRHCSHPLSENSSAGTVVQTGNHSTVIGTGERSTTEVVYGDKIVSSPSPEVVKLTATTDFRTPVKSVWSVLLGAIGLAASLITVLSFFSGGITGALNNEGSMPLQPWLAAVSVLLCGFGVWMWKQKFIWLYFFNLIEDPRGRIRLTSNLQGDCPKCDGVLRLRYVGPEGAKKLKAVCSSKPSRHVYEWDYE